MSIAVFQNFRSNFTFSKRDKGVRKSATGLHFDWFSKEEIKFNRSRRYMTLQTKICGFTLWQSIYSINISSEEYRTPSGNSKPGKHYQVILYLSTCVLNVSL